MRRSAPGISPPAASRRRFLGQALAAGAVCLGPPALGQATRQIADSAGRTVVLPAKVERVFAAGPPAGILLYALAPDKLIGWTNTWREDERAFIPKRYADLPTLGRLTGRGNTANIEVVLAAKPDLILDYGSINPTYVSLADRTQQQAGIPYALIDGSFDRMPDAFRLLGAMLDEPARGEELARYAQDTVAEIDRRVAAVPPDRRPRVYYARGPRGLDTGLAGSINVESLERVGAVNVAAALGRGGMNTVSMEQILLWDPEVIVTIDAHFFAAVKQDPMWRDVKAVKDGRVYLSPTLPYGWVDFPPSFNRLIGLRWLAKLLYPAVFPEDLRPAVRDFYTRFYHQQPSEPQLDQLLQGLR
ncbi:MAG: iron ABC transporter substrate-binding protein [Alphaproteobacteria bacterium]|nr:iron ABC transporter substrate-binding protein [Alphaproteobacteria bacterium]